MKLPSFVRKMKLSRRILLGYVLMIFLPIMLLSAMFYRNVYLGVKQDYAASRQQLLTDSCTNLEINLTQIERIYESLQYNKSLLEYLSDRYSERDAVYNLLKYIRPVLSNLALSSPYIESIRVYKSDAEPVAMPPEIQNLSALEGGDELLRSLGFGGQWVVRDDLRLDYQKVMYSEGYTRQTGLLRVTTEPTLMNEFMENIQSIMQGSEALLIKEGRVLYGEALDALDASDRELLAQSDAQGQSQLLYLPGSQRYANEARVSRLGLRLILLPSDQGLSRELSLRSLRFFALIFALLALVSGFYFYLGTSITQRVKRLLAHMQTVGENSMAPFEDHSVFEDEISALALTFNQMLLRIQDLIITVNRAELLRREAEYKALQAQIRPHFFYNTMEAIRLMAEDHDDFDTADACYAFSCLMRYSLSRKQEVITLADEVRNAEYYLRMYKLRMGYKFEYVIHAEDDLQAISCPKFILQPLLENSIVHGISKANPKGVITLNITRNPPNVIVSIMDNGVGMSPERLRQVRAALDQGQSADCFGVANVNERVRTFFGGPSGLEYASEQGKYTLCTLLLRVKEQPAAGGR